MQLDFSLKSLDETTQVSGLITTAKKIILTLNNWRTNMLIQQSYLNHYSDQQATLPIPKRPLLLNTPEHFMRSQLLLLKQQCKKHAKKLKLIRKLEWAQTQKLDRLKYRYKVLDRKLAFRDERLKICKARLNSSKPKTKRKKLTYARKLINKLSAFDKQALLNELNS